MSTRKEVEHRMAVCVRLCLRPDGAKAQEITDVLFGDESNKYHPREGVLWFQEYLRNKGFKILFGKKNRADSGIYKIPRSPKFEARKQIS